MTKKRPALLLWLPPLLLLTLTVVAQLIRPDSLRVLPAAEETNLWPWAERVQNDSSRILSFEEKEQGFSMRYQLEAMAPYAGVTIQLGKKHWDIADYDYIDICFDKGSSATQLSLSYHLDGFSRAGEPQSLRITTEPIHRITQCHYRIPIRQISTPTWWYRENNVQKGAVPSIDYRHLAAIGFVNGDNLELETEQFLGVKSLCFTKKEQLSRALLLKLLALNGAFLLLYWLLLHSKTPLPALKKIVVGNYADDEYQRLMAYLSENFQNRNLSVGVVVEQTGIASNKVSPLLQQVHGQSFKQFLNTLRLTEAKRLLRETDRTVTEIASLVGYGYVNSFNRVFKETEGKTPLVYRGEAQ